jgi:hypothetical protein
MWATIQKSGKHKVVRGFIEPNIDGAETVKKIPAHFLDNLGSMDQAEEYKKEFYKNAVYADPGPLNVDLDDAQYKSLKTKYEKLKPHECLTVGGDILPDYQGEKYWARDKDGHWKACQITEPCVNPPEGAITELSENQEKEIERQYERERILAMSPGDREKEMLGRMENLKIRARQKKEEAKIAGEKFSPKKWYREQKEILLRLFSVA